MATGRQPRPKGENTQPEILQAIRLGEHDVYGPGEEDEFLEALEAHIDEINAQMDEQDSKRPRLSLNDELFRLSALGKIVNFAEVAEEDMEHTDADLRANQAAASEAALVEGVPAKPRRKAGRRGRQAVAEEAE